MRKTDYIQANQRKLNQRYKELIEQAYNFRQTDSALSDFYEYRAIKILHRLNRLRYLSRESSLQLLH